MGAVASQWGSGCSGPSGPLCYVTWTPVAPFLVVGVLRGASWGWLSSSFHFPPVSPSITVSNGLHP